MHDLGRASQRRPRPKRSACSSAVPLTEHASGVPPEARWATGSSRR